MGIYKPGAPKKYNPTTRKGQMPPHEPGEYRIVDENGNVVYIGETNDLKRRMNEHIKSGKLKKDWGVIYGIYICIQNSW